MFDVARPSSPAKRGGDLRTRQRPSEFRCRGDLQDGEGIGMREFAPEGGKCSRVVLTKRRAERVHLTLTAPDRRLLRSCEQFDALDELGVTSTWSMVVSVRAHQVSEDHRISRVELRPRGRVALPIAGRRRRIDRVDHVASGSSAVTTRPRSSSIPTTTASFSSLCAATSWWGSPMPPTLSETLRLASTAPSPAIAQMS
jgi:hypothetical protein